jgi:nitrate/TMAO reductase-like tetraheme cytochrome c subunit
LALRELTRHPVSMLGAALAVVSGILIVALTVMMALDFGGGPYTGILAYMIMPGFFVAGLVLMPLGAWLQRRREARAAAGGKAVPRLPVFDLNDGETRTRLLIFAGLTAVNLVVIGLAGYGGITFMETTDFCGSCHKVMDPEHDAHAVSSHARVECVGCHIGPGASWFVKSKLSGAWQVISVTFDLYSRPIPTPVHALRPARGTCENCHLPARFVGDRLQVRNHYDSDQANTPLKTVLNFRVGGRGGTGLSGIHWHVGEGVEVRYLADPTRQKIFDVELKSPDGTRKTFKTKEAAPAGAEWRVVDCIDCHNRPGHAFYLPEREIDAAMDAQTIDAGLPFVRREALRLLNEAKGSHEEVKKSFPAELHAFYAKAYPDLEKAKGAAIDRAGAAMAEAYSRNVWPLMKIGWGTYPNNVGHPHRDDPRESPGCWRCHDEAHADASGKTISQDCTLCHEVLADGEKDPRILKVLRP